MQGHELPGPNQKDPSPAKLEMPWDDSSTLETQEQIGDIMKSEEGSGAGFGGSGRMERMMEVRKGERKSVGAPSQFIKGGGEDVGSAQVYTPPDDTGTDISAGIGTELSDDTSTAKKNVDVEVTVNGQKI